MWSRRDGGDHLAFCTNGKGSKIPPKEIRKSNESTPPLRQKNMSILQEGKMLKQLKDKPNLSISH